MEKKNCNHRGFKILLTSILGLIVISAIGFFIYASNYYRAVDVATTVMEEDRGITVQGDLTILSPSVPTDTALIFYPGAKVEHIAYLPILEKLKGQGITCILVKMPFNMAIFDSDAAAKVMEEFPDIENWYIGGHSMGGAMASSYASKHQDKVQGLILLGAYIYGNYPPEDALTIYGTFNSNLEKHINYTENIVVIEGGNHAQFGNYGEQKGDPKATITTEEQQNIAVESIMKFINKRRYN